MKSTLVISAMVLMWMFPFPDALHPMKMDRKTLGPCNPQEMHASLRVKTDKNTKLQTRHSANVPTCSSRTFCDSEKVGMSWPVAVDTLRRP